VTDYGNDFVLRQSIDGEGSHVRLSNPRRIEFRPEHHDQQRAKCRDPVRRPTEDFQACGVGPVRILEDHQHWTLLSQCLDLCRECFKRSLSVLLWG